MSRKVDEFARAIHDLCVAAGAECPEARCAAHTKHARTRRRNLTLAECERMRRA